MDEAGVTPSENALAGWLNADLFVTGLKEAGPSFDQQKVIDAINKITDYTADGIIYPRRLDQGPHRDERRGPQLPVLLDDRGQ